MEAGEKANEPKRKVRSDKKKVVAPFITDKEREFIFKLAVHLNIPEGQVGTLLIKTALYSEECARYFIPFYYRDFVFRDEMVFIGHHDAQSISPLIERYGEDKGRFKIKMSQHLYHRLADFQNAIRAPFASQACYLLIRYALLSKELLEQIAPNFRMPEKPAIRPAQTETSALSIF